MLLLLLRGWSLVHASLLPDSVEELGLLPSLLLEILLRRRESLLRCTLGRLDEFGFPALELLLVFVGNFDRVVEVEQRAHIDVQLVVAQERADG